MDLGKVGTRIAMNTEPGKLAVGVMMLIHWILGWFVASVVVFLRKNFGERYLSYVNLIFGLTAVGFFTGLGNSLLSGSIRDMSKAIEIAYYAVIGLGIYHRVVIARKNKKGIAWHSFNPGQSLIQLPGVSAETVAKWIEPALLFVLAYIASKFHDAPMSLWLKIGGFALLVHENVSAYMQRQQFLDMRDAMIESRNWGAVMSGKPVQQTEGYTIAQSNLQLMERTPGMKDAFQSLPDDMKAILDPEAA